MTSLVLAQAAAPPPPAGLLITAALVGIALIVVLITRFKVHPFLSLTVFRLAWIHQGEAAPEVTNWSCASMPHPVHDRQQQDHHERQHDGGGFPEQQRVAFDQRRR